MGACKPFLNTQKLCCILIKGERKGELLLAAFPSKRTIAVIQALMARRDDDVAK